MVEFLIKRPIAVTMSLIAVLVLGILAANFLPVSLMPEVKIPQVTVQVTAENLSARELDATVVKPLRNQLTQLNHLKNIRTETRDGSSTIFMEFEHGSDIDFIFIEVNEKIDRTTLPKDIERPRTLKANATDIPAFYLNLTLKENIPQQTADIQKFIELSKFGLSVISKRIEQIPEVAMVDISGQILSEISIIPNLPKLQALHIEVADLEKAILGNNINLGNLTIRDGEYQYNIRFSSTLTQKEDIENVYCKINGRLYQIKDLAQVKEVPQGQIGFVKSDGKSALTLAIVKQADARMSDLKKEIHQLTETFRKDYPHIDFTITRDQTALLDYSIDNLTQNLLVGILLACLVIFFFMQDFRSPLLITLTIPISLIITLLCMFVTRISLNVISLSGIVLGVGMMVDNSIIVIDNITQKWDKGEKLKTAVIKGTNEVFTPMLSSVLTTCSVFIPLIFMSGISGALFYDQAMAVTIGLFSSLAVSLIVIPVYYYRFYKKQEKRSRNRFLSRFHLMDYEKIYENGLKWIFRHQVLTWGILIGMIAGSCGIYLVIEKRKFPPITQNDLLLNIEWNKRINAVENERRTSRLTDHLKPLLSQYTVMAGSQKFLLAHTKENSVSEAIVYLKTVHPDSIPVLKEKIRSYLENNYPEALYSTESSGNIFDMIFAEKEPTLVARIRSINGKSPEPDLLNQLLRSIRDKLLSVHIEPVAWQEVVQLLTQPDLMTLYGIDYNRLFYKLKSAFNENRIFYMNEGEYSIPVLLGEEEKTLQHILRTTTVKNDAGIDIPLSLLLRENRINDLKNIISGAEGEYYPLQLEVKEKNIPDITRQITAVVAADRNFEVSFSGSYYSNREMIKELSAILVVSLLLLYFILAAQFESLIQPLIILSEIGIDLFGALFLLWICGSSINIMSMIGIIVMCGIVINDSILKVDTINRLRKEGKGLLKAILMAGNKRLKPIIMTSLTTILAILPFLFTGNLGADLQFPLSLAIIGGMTVGTIVSVYFIPLGYYYIYKTRQS